MVARQWKFDVNMVIWLQGRSRQIFIGRPHWRHIGRLSKFKSELCVCACVYVSVCVYVCVSECLCVCARTCVCVCVIEKGGLCAKGDTDWLGFRPWRHTWCALRCWSSHASPPEDSESLLWAYLQQNRAKYHQYICATNYSHFSHKLIRLKFGFFRAMKIHLCPQIGPTFLYENAEY